MNKTALAMTAAGLIGGTAIAVTVTMFASIPPSPVPASAIVSTPSPVLILPPSPMVTPSVAPSTQAESLEDARKREELAAFKVFMQILFRHLPANLKPMPKRDLDVFSVIGVRAWTNRAEWRESFVSQPETSGTLLASAIGEIAIAHGYYIQEDTSRAIQAAIKASVLEWWNGNYERQYITKNDPY
jgi:hypothetical protein